MSRRADGGYLFIGRLSKTCRTRDIEEIFEPYGKITRCEIKYNSGPDNGSTGEGNKNLYGFVDFEDRRDAADAIKYENGRSICGSKIIVEWSKGNPRRAEDYKNNGTDRRDTKIGSDECARCHKTGHWARDCPGEFRRPSRSSSRSRSRGNSPRRRYNRSPSRSRSPSERRGSYNRRRASPMGARRGGAGAGGFRNRSRS